MRALDHQLLALVPFDEFEWARSHGVVGIAFLVGVLGDYAQGCQAVHESDAWLLEPDFHGGRVDGLDAIQIGQVQNAGRLLAGFIGECHIFGREWLAIGKLGVIANGDGPGLAVFGQLPLGGQIAFQVEFFVALEQGGLKQRVAIPAPATDGVKALLRFTHDGQHQAAAVGILSGGGGCRS